jgi:argininosuccinate synthase
MNPTRIVLAYTGHPASCAAVRWLADTSASDVVALIVDVGQGDDLEEMYTRALNSGARRAHVVDRCEAFARHVIVPAASARAPLDERALRGLAHPVIAAALIEVAAIESADVVAHASMDDALEAEVHALDPARRVLAPAREWLAQRLDVAEYVKMLHLPASAVHADRHLLMRRSSPSSATDPARVTIGFEGGIPASVNGVAMGLPELIESLSLIGGQYGLDASATTPAPALALLQGAYRACGGRDDVTLQLQSGSLAVVDAPPALVNHA